MKFTKSDAKLIAHCQVCNKEYNKEGIKIVFWKGSSLVIHIGCQNCKSSSLMSMTRDGARGNIITAGMLTDLSYSEAVKATKMGAITIDEVIDFYQVATSK